MKIIKNGITEYTITFGSDVVRDGFYSELCQEVDGAPVYLAEAFWSDQRNDFIVSVVEASIPFSVVEIFVAESRARVQPKELPKEVNFYEKG
jgi:hypothetical protein